MREEYLGQLDQYSSSFSNYIPARYRLNLLDEGKARDAIQRPVMKRTLSISQEATDELLKALSQVRISTEGGQTIVAPGEFIEPVLLQVVCAGIWDKLLKDNRIKEDAEIGIDDVIRYGNVNKALAGFYDEAVADACNTCAKACKPLSEDTLRSWCESQLITRMKTRGSATCEDASTVGIPGEAVQVLEGRHLIRTEQRMGARWIELAHDTLIQAILDSNREKRFWGDIPGIFAQEESLNTWLKDQSLRMLRLYKLARQRNGKSLEQQADEIEDVQEGRDCREDARLFASLLFASRFLDGTLHLTHQFPDTPDMGYDLLEKVWLRDVKYFNAYLLWESNRSGLDIYPQNNYFKACDRLCESLRNNKNKPSPSLVKQEFKKVEDYLNRKYQRNSKGYYDLVDMKAYWYWQSRQCDSDTKSSLHHS